MVTGCDRGLTGLDGRLELLRIHPAGVHVDQQVGEAADPRVENGRPALAASGRLGVVQVLAEQPGERADGRGSCSAQQHTAGKSPYEEQHSSNKTWGESSV